jgi:uncharacterized membrane protein YeiB
MAGRSTTYHLAPALVAIGAMLVAGNWFLQPERAAAWASLLVLLGCMAVALLIVARRDPETAGARAGSSIRDGVVFAGLMLAISLGVKLAAALNLVTDTELPRRATMVVLGAFLVSTGNTMPKTLRPLTSRRCDPAGEQAFQRFAGWTWVLTGLLLGLVWIVLPVDLAKPVSTVVLAIGILTIVARLLRWHRARPSEVWARSVPGDSEPTQRR